MCESNPKKLPIFVSSKDKVFSRGSFLDGSAITYFGPGQDPSCIMEYSEPTEWRDVGSLFRMPQVVWLSGMAYGQNDSIPASQLTASYNNSVAITYIGQPLDESFVNAILPDPRFNYHSPFDLVIRYLRKAWTWDLIYQGGVRKKLIQTVVDASDGVTLENPDGLTWAYEIVDGPPAPPTSTWIGIDNSHTQHDRLMDIFAAAKDRIETLRPGKTWVRVNEWFPNKPVTSDDVPYDSGSIFYPLVSMLVPPEPDSAGYSYFGDGVPPTVQDDYIGTDFLNVWVGPPMSNLDNQANKKGVPWDMTLYSDLIKDQFLKAKKRFRRLGVHFWGPDTSYSTSELPSPPPTVPPTVPDGFIPWGGEAEVEPSSFAQASELYLYSPDNPTAFANAAARVSENYANDLSVYMSQLAAKSSWESDNPSQQADDINTYHLIVDDLDDDCVQYQGTSSELTVDSLVEAIADFFGFDSSTGKDKSLLS